jgi:hypothetical protein
MTWWNLPAAWSKYTEHEFTVQFEGASTSELKAFPLLAA